MRATLKAIIISVLVLAKVGIKMTILFNISDFDIELSGIESIYLGERYGIRA